MPNFNDAIEELPQSFRREQQELDRAGIKRWSSIRDLTDLQLRQLARSGQASARNLKRLFTLRRSHLTGPPFRYHETLLASYARLGRRSGDLDEK